VDFEEAFTEGATEEEAAFNAAEVLSLVIEQRLADGQSIPWPSPSEGRPVASPQARVQVALLLRKAREEQGRTLAEMAPVKDDKLLYSLIPRVSNHASKVSYSLSL
jgi:antitoxin HicB